MLDFLDFGNYLQREGCGRDNIANLLRLAKRVPLGDETALREYLTDILDKGRSSSYYNKHIQLIKHHFKFIGNKAAADNFHQIKEVSRQFSTFSDEQIDDFLALRKPGSNMNMFFVLMANHGTRLSEIRCLRRKDLNLAAQAMTVKGKNGYRTIPIHPFILDELTKYVENTLFDQNNTEGWLFPHRTKKNQPMSRSGYRKEFARRLEILGVTDPNVVPYSFRHSFATKAVEEQAMDNKNLAGLMGSSELTILKRYARGSVKGMRCGMVRMARDKNAVTVREKFKQIADYASEIFGDTLTISRSENELRISV